MEDASAEKRSGRNGKSGAGTFDDAGFLLTSPAGCVMMGSISNPSIPQGFRGTFRAGVSGTLDGRRRLRYRIP
jgi:hypothetical protein